MTDKEYGKLLYDEKIGLNEFLEKCIKADYGIIEDIMTREEVKEKIVFLIKLGITAHHFLEMVEKNPLIDAWYWRDLTLIPIKTKEDFDNLL